MNKHDFFAISQYAVIVNQEGKILLLKASNKTKISGKWSLPGGHLQKGELSEDSPIREVREETNLKINMIIPIDTDLVGDTYSVIFSGRLSKESDVLLSEEHEDYRWVTPEEMQGLELLDSKLISYASKAKRSFNF